MNINSFYTKFLSIFERRPKIGLDGGRVVAQGTHYELLVSCELYRKLWTAHDVHE